MTVIVWDGNTMAADKQITIGSLKLAGTKIFKINECLVGFSGDFDFAQSMKFWFENGGQPEKYPANQSDETRWVGMLVVTPELKVYKYERSPYPMDMTEAGVYAFGSGREFALGAIAMGADAIKAVQVASRYDTGCGFGVDVLRIGEDK